MVRVQMHRHDTQASSFLLVWVSVRVDGLAKRLPCTMAILVYGTVPGEIGGV